MKYLQQLKDDFQQVKENAKRVFDPDSDRFNPELAEYYKGCSAAFSYCIQELDLLLNEQPEAITDDAHFCKHEVRRSAAGDESQGSENLQGASYSETSGVRQNEENLEDA